MPFESDKLDFTEAAIEKWLGRMEMNSHRADARMDNLITALNTEFAAVHQKLNQIDAAMQKNVGVAKAEFTNLDHKLNSLDNKIDKIPKTTN